MDVMIIASKNCSHCVNLSRELDELGVDCRMLYGEVKFRRQPTEHECLSGQ